MIAVNTNLLVYAHRRDSEFHNAAAQRIKALAESLAVWAIPWPCVHEFFAIATHPRIYAPPTPAGVALAQIDAWLASPTLALLAESGRHWRELRGLVEAARQQCPAVHDACIAALCLQHGVSER